MINYTHKYGKRRKDMYSPNTREIKNEKTRNGPKAIFCFNLALPIVIK